MEEAELQDELLSRAARGAGRALGELERASQDLARPWPRVSPDVIDEGRSAVGRAAAALRTLAERLGANDTRR